MYEYLSLMGITNPLFASVILCLTALLPFATLGFMFSKSMEKEPSYLINFDRMKKLEGPWTILLVVTAPLVFIYNAFAWAFWSVIVIAEFLAGLVTKFYNLIVVHVIAAFKWLYHTLQIPNWWKVPKWLFMNVIWVPVKFIAKTGWHYIIVWGWDLYVTSFQSLKGVYNTSKIKSGFIGGFLSLFIIGVSIYLALLFDLEVIGLVGLVISSLPALKASGEITAMNHSDSANASEHGMAVMKSAVKYVIVAIGSLFVIQILLWASIIPDVGLTILGIAVNTNVLLSGIVLLSFFVLAFATAIFPNYLLYNKDDQSIKDSFVSYLNVIKEKGVQLFAVSIPGAAWSGIAIALPALLIYASISVSDSIKKDFYIAQIESNETLVQESADSLQSAVELFAIDSISIGTLQATFEDCIAEEVNLKQKQFSHQYPDNVIENIEIVFTDDSTRFSGLFDQRVEDQNKLIESLMQKRQALQEDQKTKQNYLDQFESEKWSFVVQRRYADSEGDEGWKTVVSNTDMSKFVDTDVDKGESYEYRIKAKNISGSSKWSSVLTKSIPDDMLIAPSRLVAKNELNFRNKLYWNDNSYNEEEFIIERRKWSDDDAWSEWEILASVGADVNSYTDTKIKSNVTYQYRVFCSGMGDDSATSNVESVTPAISVPRVTDTGVNKVSTMMDWRYNFAWSKSQAPRRQISTPNGDVPPFENNEISFKAELIKEIDAITSDIAQLDEDIAKEEEIKNMYADLIDYNTSELNTYSIFKNISVIFAILFVAIFGGILLGILYVYYAKLYYAAYTIREKEEWYFITEIKEAQKENSHQPLLGFTLLIVFVILQNL